MAKNPENRNRLATVLYNLLETIRVCSILLQPFMPSAMPKIWARIGVSENEQTWLSAKTFGVLSQTTSVSLGEAIFPRINIEQEMQALSEL